VTFTNFFHVGILVPELNVALEQFQVTGIKFTPPTVAHCDHYMYMGKTGTLDLRIAFSIAESPYIELMEAQPDGLYGPEAGYGHHHIGLWESNCENRVAYLQSNGFLLEAAQYDDGQNLSVAYLSGSAMPGVRYELVSLLRRPALENWIAGGAYS
jgi:hypothetical protein